MDFCNEIINHNAIFVDEKMKRFQNSYIGNYKLLKHNYIGNTSTLVLDLEDYRGDSFKFAGQVPITMFNCDDTVLSNHLSIRIDLARSRSA